MLKKFISLFLTFILISNATKYDVDPKELSSDEDIDQIICLDSSFENNEDLPKDKEPDPPVDSKESSSGEKIDQNPCVGSGVCNNEVLQKDKKLRNAMDPKELSLDEKIGQMFCLDFMFWNDQNEKSVTKINDEIREIIAKYHVGAVILFSQNFVNKDQSKKLISDFQKAATDAGNPPLIIAVDQEGGVVERFSFGRKKFKNNADIKTAQEAFEKGEAIAEELKQLGINCDFAPVVDVNSNPNNPVINVRSFSDNADIVAEFGKRFLYGLHSQNIMGSAKHFPGHGDTSVDSHLALPTVNKTLEELEQLELKPFRELINAGVDMIMTAHIQLPKIERRTAISKKDGKEICLPATLSKTILTDLLRRKMGFGGVIVTDSMIMKAISENFGELQAAKMAISSGADMLCIPVVLRSKRDVSELEALIKCLKDAVSSGEIPEEQINQSVARIFKLKEKYCV